MKDYIVALSPIDNEPVKFSPSQERELIASGWSILPDASDYEAELMLWEKQLEAISGVSMASNFATNYRS